MAKSTYRRKYLDSNILLKMGTVRQKVEDYRQYTQGIRFRKGLKFKHTKHESESIYSRFSLNLTPPLVFGLSSFFRICLQKQANFF